MSFAEELRSISSDESLEERIWEQMKPYLREIAAERHPNGCLVTFEGISNSVIQTVGNLIRKEDMNFEYYFLQNFPSVGIIMWKYVTAWRKGDVTPTNIGISRQLLKVHVTKSKEVLINTEPVTEDYKLDSCNYV